MDLRYLGENALLYFLLFARIIAVIEVAPLLSSSSVPQIAKVTLALMTALIVLPGVAESGYPIPENGLSFAFLVVGEAILGIIIGFFLVVIFTAFQVAGQFFSLQMGFGASEVYDPLAQIEIPLMGQYINLMAMFVFVSVGGFQKVFYTGILQSFRVARAYDFLTQRDYLLDFMGSSIGGIFAQALVISLPILGILMIESITMGLLAKAAPQMNLLMMGFPVSIGLAFLGILLITPYLIEAFTVVIDDGFGAIMEFLTNITRVRG